MEEHFETCDLFLASYLLATGHRLESIDASDPQRQVFCIAPYPTIETLAGFADGRATVNVQAFLQAERMLKRRIWDIRDGREVRR